MMSANALQGRASAAIIALAGLVCLASQQAIAADEDRAPKGAAVTVLTAAKYCFPDIVEVSGVLVPREETAVRPDRPGLKVAEIMVDPGETVTAGQPLARLTLPEGGSIQIQAPVAGLVSADGRGRGRAGFAERRSAVFHPLPQ